MASKRGKTNFAIPINGTLAESIEKLNGELRRVLVEDIRTALRRSSGCSTESQTCLTVAQGRRAHLLSIQQLFL